MTQESRFPFLLVILPVLDGMIEAPAFFPFFFGNGEHAAVIHDVLPFKSHASLAGAGNGVNRQILLKKFQRPVFGKREHVAVHVAAGG